MTPTHARRVRPLVALWWRPVPISFPHTLWEACRAPRALSPSQGHGTLRLCKRWCWAMEGGPPPREGAVLCTSRRLPWTLALIASRPPLPSSSPPQPGTVRAAVLRSDAVTARQGQSRGQGDCLSSEACQSRRETASQRGRRRGWGVWGTDHTLGPSDTHTHDLQAQKHIQTL